jgi:hypothetical protein
MPIKRLASLLLLVPSCQAAAPAPDSALVLTGTAEVTGAGDEFRLELAPGIGGRLLGGGPLGGELVSDGARVWERHWNNPVRELHRAERETALLQFAVLDGTWDDAGGPVERIVDGAAVHLRWRGGATLYALETDPATGEPVQVARADEGGLEGLRLEDWGEIGGVRVPRTIRRGTLDALHDVYRVIEVGRAPALEFERPADPPRDWFFDGATPTTLEAKRARTGHVLVHPAVDGADHGWFIFDSGAGAMCLDPDVAQALAARRIGAVTAVGVAGRAAAEIYSAHSFTLGPLTLRNPIFVALELDFIGAAMGEKIVGIVGNEVFARTIVEFQAGETLRLALHDRDSFTLPPAAVWTEMLLDGNLPCVRARFEGEREGLFRLDTGAGGTMAFHAGAVKKWNLLEGRATQVSIAGGVGGMQAIRAGKIAWFELAGHRFESLDVGFYTGAGGAFADHDLDGNLGLDLLGKFRLIFDYRASRLAFAAPE